MSMIFLPAAGITFESMACADYVAGRIDVDQLEGEIELILAGGVPQRFVGGLPPVPRPPSDAAWSANPNHPKWAGR